MNGHRMDDQYVVFVEQLDISPADADSGHVCKLMWRVDGHRLGPERWSTTHQLARLKVLHFDWFVLPLDSTFVNPQDLPTNFLELPQIPTMTLDKGSRRKRSEIWPYAWVMKFRNKKMKLFPYSWKIVRQPYSRTPWKENPRSTPIFFFRGRG